MQRNLRSRGIDRQHRCSCLLLLQLHEAAKQQQQLADGSYGDKAEACRRSRTAVSFAIAGCSTGLDPDDSLANPIVRRALSGASTKAVAPSPGRTRSDLGGSSNAVPGRPLSLRWSAAAGCVGGSLPTGSGVSPSKRPGRLRPAASPRFNRHRRPCGLLSELRQLVERRVLAASDQAVRSKQNYGPTGSALLVWERSEQCRLHRTRLLSLSK